MSRRHRSLRVVAGIASAGVLVGTVLAGSATLAADHLADNVTTIDISHQVGERPVDYGDLESGPVNILVMGSDSRSGKGNKGYGEFEGARSDTTMLVHIYPDRDSALVLSIPRDTVTDLPSCKSPDGSTLGPIRERFNSAFDRGGPGCTVKAVEQLTGLRVDHFVVLDFNGFKKTIDALGGVEVCLTRPLQDRQSGVDLPAGRTRVSGEQALGFVRVRHNIGDGSDIGRINRQQLFLSSLIQEVSRSRLLTDPLRMWRVLSESSKSVATDKAMADTKAILALGSSLVGIRPDDITFVTLPWIWNPADPNTVVVDAARAAPLLTALRTNEPWPPPPTEGADGRALKATPNQVTVSIRNATGQRGRATAAAGRLTPQGFHVAALGTDAQTRKATSIRHSPEELEAARTLQAAVPGAILVEDDDAGDTLVLILGRSYEGVETIRVKGSRPAREATGTATADQDICTG